VPSRDSLFFCCLVWIQYSGWVRRYKKRRTERSRSFGVAFIAASKNECCCFACQKKGMTVEGEEVGLKGFCEV